MPRNNFTLTVPAGTYWLGDPCYSVPSDLWIPLLESCDFFNLPVGTVNGHKVYASPTAYGDGEYVGSDGYSYPVDAGLIGLVPEALVTEEPSGFSRKITVDHDFIFGYEDGTIMIDTIKIPTDLDEEEEDEVYEAEHYDDEDEDL
jgi:hypothetical protein